MVVMSKIFTKRGGTTDKGKIYDDLMLALLAHELSTDHKVEQFKLSSKDKNLHGFDSAILEVKFREGETRNYCMKLKYTQSSERQVKMDNFAAPKKDFSLKKNFEDFRKVTNKNQTFILYTTRSVVADLETEMELSETFPFKVKMFKQQVRPEIELITNTEANVDHVYQFRIVEVEGVDLSDEQRRKIGEYQDFFQKFFLFTNQRSLEEVEVSTVETFKRRHRCDEGAFKSYFEFVTRWSNRDSKKISLNKRVVRLKIAECLLSPYMKIVSGEKDCDVMEDAILSFDVTVFDLAVAEDVVKIWGTIDEEPDDETVKKLQQVGKWYELLAKSFDSFSDLSTKERNKLLWYLNQMPMVVEIDDSNQSRVMAAIDLGHWKHTRKKFVLIGETDEEFSQGSKVFRNLDDLRTINQPLYEEIVDTFFVTLQGRAAVTLKQAMGVGDEMRQAVTTNELIRMIDTPLPIGEDKETLPDIYVKRSLSKFVLPFSLVRHLKRDTHLSVVSYSERIQYGSYDFASTTVDHHLQQNFKPSNKFNLVKKGECTGHEFEEVCAKNPTKICHLFKAVDSDYLEWVTSNGDIDDLRPHQVTNKYLVEETEIFDYFTGGITLVCDDPGMGKSMLMKYVKNNYSPDYWVVLIQVREHYQFFETKRQALEVLDHVLSEEYSDFESRVLDIYRRKTKVVLLWDGLDELFAYCINNVLDAVLELSRMGFVQWLTARGNLRDDVETKFGVFSTKLRPFDEEQQRFYVRNRLGSKLTDEEEARDLENKIIDNIALVRNNGFLGIPLQLHMLTELLLQNKDSYKTLLSNVLSMTDLYRHFTEAKFEFCHHKANCDFSNYLLCAILDENRTFQNPQYEAAAMSACFQDTNFDSFQDLIDDIRREGDQFGFITRIDDKNVPVFAHKTYAEYFAALRLSNDDQGDARLFDNDRRNVRYFVDVLLAEEHQAHLAVLYRNFEFLEANRDQVGSKDRGGRSPLHLCCAWSEPHWLVEETCTGSNSYHISKGILGTVKEEDAEFKNIASYLLDRCDPLELDGWFKWNSLSYADRSLSLFMLEGILRRGYQVQSDSLKNYKSACTLLYYAVKFDYPNAFRLAGNIPYIHMNGIYEGNLLLMATELGRNHFINRLVKVKQYTQVLSAIVEDSLETAVHIAARSGNLEAIGFFYDQGADLEVTVGYSKQRPLHLAAIQGYLGVVEFLLEKGVQVGPLDNSGYTPLHYASGSGHFEIVEALLRSGASFEVKSKEQGVFYARHSPLCLAAEGGHYEIVKVLVKVLEETSPEVDLVKPLHRASGTGHVDIIRFLVDHQPGGNRLNLSARYGDLETVKALVPKDQNDVTNLLRLAIEGNHSDIVGFLIGRLEDLSSVFELLKAAMIEGVELVKTFLSNGVDVNTPDSKGANVLHHTIKEETVKFLLNQGANVNAVDGNGNTPLHLAAENDRVGLVRLLVEHGACVNIANTSNVTPLVLAVRNMHLEMVQILVGADAHLEFPGSSLLHEITEHSYMVLELMDYVNSRLSCRHPYLKRYPYLKIFSPEFLTQETFEWGHKNAWNEVLTIVKLLVSRGVDVEIQNGDGYRPLHLACGHARLSLVRFYLNEGAEVNVASQDGSTPLHCVVDVQRLNKMVVGYLHSHDAILPENCVKIVNLLIEKGADVNARDGVGETPLHLAAWNGDLEVARILVAGGAVVDVVNEEGNSPLGVAKKERQMDVEKFLSELMGVEYQRPDMDLVPYGEPEWFQMLKFLRRKWRLNGWTVSLSGVAPFYNYQFHPPMMNHRMSKKRVGYLQLPTHLS